MFCPRLVYRSGCNVVQNIFISRTHRLPTPTTLSLTRHRRPFAVLCRRRCFALSLSLSLSLHQRRPLCSAKRTLLSLQVLGNHVARTSTSLSLKSRILSKLGVASVASYCTRMPDTSSGRCSWAVPEYILSPHTLHLVSNFIEKFTREMWPDDDSPIFCRYSRGEASQTAI
ncbi:hypothetical protein B0J12DRAFT_134368 [Macrophomina phaseolina]|uniref:Uncharacterized protein n=1 Tax=Macrophomina phaseolina TaxID=35725 RepID=A0ABQ8G9M3_9PEZI|nr:hypothetical protein B0J12DRAFT_134368 [Macrophomina phaseolina]